MKILRNHVLESEIWKLVRCMTRLCVANHKIRNEYISSDLQMIVVFIRIYFCAGVQMEFGMKRELLGLIFLEFLDSDGLLDPTLENPSHALYN